MASNTKLNQAQKDNLKCWKMDNPKALFFNNGIVTALVENEFNNSRMCRVALSTMSPDETKFRVKVGQYHALCKMNNSNYVLMDMYTLDNFLCNIGCFNT